MTDFPSEPVPDRAHGYRPNCISNAGPAVLDHFTMAACAHHRLQARGRMPSPGVGGTRAVAGTTLWRLSGRDSDAGAKGPAE